VSYTQNEWAGGLTANLVVTTTGTGSINGWQLGFRFPGDTKVSNTWNAALAQAGGSVTATNVSCNATFSPDANVTFGFQGTWELERRQPDRFHPQRDELLVS
jgi:cellulase/cellobiase CelA1